MCNYVLFSPVGITDPIRDGYDGAMLHILRYYRPQKVCIFLTAEMCVYKKRDNRYEKMIKKLCESLGFKCAIEYCEEPDLTDPSDNNLFENLFRQNLIELHKNNPGSQILLNTSSGTPQMKAALRILSVCLPFNTVPIQVRTPANKSNSSNPQGDNFDENEEWDNLLDNLEGSKNRCSEVENENLYHMFAVENIKSHMKNYDYQAAYTTALGVKELLDDKVFSLIEGVKYKTEFNYSKSDKCIGNTDVDKSLIYPRQTEHQKSIFEYILYMSNKQIRGEYIEFCRAISPVLTELLSEYLEKKLHLKLDLITEEKGKIKMLIPERIKELDGGKTLNVLDREYAEFKSVPISARPLSYIAENSLTSQKDTGLKKCIGELRDFEYNVRHPVAHQLIGMTDEKMKEMAGKTSKDIIYNLKKLYSAVYGKEDHWDNYDKINEYIIGQL